MHNHKALLFACLMAPVLGHATEKQDPPPPFRAELQAPVERPSRGNFVGEPGISPELLTEGFLAAHPDLRWRREGLHAYANQRYDEAMNHFLRAAKFADKPSQAMIAEMYWKGIGVPRDRPLGYAWMDLAAERFYSNFVILREQYWGGIGEIERQDAITRGQPLLAEYGDDVAKPRMARVLRKERPVTGSRVGFVGNLQIIPFTGPNAGTGLSIRADEYYAPKYWKADEYFKWQDQVWHAPPVKQGRVEVGDLERADKDAPADGEPKP